MSVIRRPCDISDHKLGIKCAVFHWASLVVVSDIPNLTIQLGFLEPSGNVVLGQTFAVETDVQRYCCSLRVSFCEKTKCLAVVSFIGLVHMIRVSDDNLSGEVIGIVDVKILSDFHIIDSIGLYMNILTIEVGHEQTYVNLATGNVLRLDTITLTENSTLQFGRVETVMVGGSMQKKLALGQKVELDDRRSKHRYNGIFSVKSDPQTGFFALFSDSDKIFVVEPEDDMLSGKLVCTIDLTFDVKLTDAQRFLIQDEQMWKFCRTGIPLPCPPIPYLKGLPRFNLSMFFLDGSTVWFASNTEICFVEFGLDSTKSKVVCLNRMKDDKSSLGTFQLLSITRYEDLIVFTTRTHGYQIYDRETKEIVCELW